MLVTNKSSATGIPPNVVSPFNVPETIPVKIWSHNAVFFGWSILSLIKLKKILLLNKLINVLFGDKNFNK